MREEKQNFKKLIRFLGFTLIVLSLTRIILAVYSGNLLLQEKNLALKKQEAEEVNRRLQEKIARATSFSLLAVRAKESGFVKPEAIIYLKKSLPLALKNQ